MSVRLLPLGFLAGLWLAVLAAGCIDQCEPPFPPASVIDKWRVLSIKAEPPEIAPGETTTLTFLSADPKGLIKTSSYLPFPSCISNQGPVEPSAFWIGCLLGVGPVTPRDSTCTNLPFSTAPPDGGSTDGGSTDGGLPDLDTNLFRPAFPPCGEPAIWTAPANYLDPLSDDEKRKGGEALLVNFTRYQGQEQISLKRVRISTREPNARNQNPRLLGLTLAGQSPTCCRPDTPDSCEILDFPSDQRIEIQALYDSASLQPLPDPTPEQTHENLQIAWYINQGELDTQSTLITGTSPPKISKWPTWFPNDYKGKLLNVGSEIMITAIARDFRGGSDWITCRFRLTAPSGKP